MDEKLIHKSFKNTTLENYDAQKYQIYLDIDPDNSQLTGNIKIIFESLQNNFSVLTLDFIGMQVDSIIMHNGQLNFNRDQGQLNINLSQPLPDKSIDSLEIYYHGKPIRGMYFRSSKYGRMVTYTHNEPFDARYWIPCKDIPDDKALLDIFITVPQNVQAFSNGKLSEVNNPGIGKLQYHWNESYPISTYLISVVCSDYEVVSQTFNWSQYQMPVEYYVYSEDISGGQNAITNTIEILQFFSDYIGMYPFIEEKYAMVQVPFREAGAMENQTISTMSESIYDVENIISHELAHQWWGDAITPESFNDIWLNEGFATYFEALFLEYKYGEESFKDRMTSAASFAVNDGSINYPLYDPPSQFLFGGAVYGKGAWVLHMLRHEIGENQFKSALRNYYQNFIYANVSTTDFKNECEHISGRDLEKFFDQWVYTAGMPTIFASWSRSNSTVNIRLEQKQNYTIYDLNLDIHLIGQTKDTLFTVNINSQSEEYKINFTDQIMKLIVDPDDKILNIDNSPVFIIPDKTELVQLYPNPFNHELNIVYRVHKFQNIELELWSITGEKITTLQKAQKHIGIYPFRWKAENLASGLYVVVLKSETGIDKQKIIFIK